MLRVIGEHGDSASRIENRIGDPAANPYLYLASQIIAGRAGIAAGIDPGPPVTAAYLSERALLPGSLAEALTAFADSALLKAELGETFHHYFHSLKQFELNRFLSAVTDWEHQEYFELF
jgi:glutamine synthetase